MRLRMLASGLCMCALVGVSAAACSDPQPATPRVTVNSTLGPGNEKDVNQVPQCALATEPWVVIGDSLHPVSDGEQQQGQTVTVACTVGQVTEGNFEVTATATLANEGSVTIIGKLTSSPDEQKIRIVFQRGDNGRFIQEDCKVVLHPAAGDPGIAPGRVWANATCPHAINDGVTAPSPSGKRTCEAVAEFRFENCSGT